MSEWMNDFALALTPFYSENLAFLGAQNLMKN